MEARKEQGGKTPLSILLQDIPDEGLHMDCAITPEVLELPPDESRVEGAFHWIGDVVKTSDGATVTGTLSGTIVRECVRCLQAFQDRISVLCTAAFQQDTDMKGQPVRGDAKKGEAFPKDFPDEVYPCIDNRVELDTILREQVILVTPIQPLCREDCLGLCQVCGDDLNQRSCGCVQRKTTPFQQFSRQLLSKKQQ